MVSLATMSLVLAVCLLVLSQLIWLIHLSRCEFVLSFFDGIVPGYYSGDVVRTAIHRRCAQSACWLRGSQVEEPRRIES